MDLISIIVPVYKVEPYLDRCVQSIVDQTYTNLEIILVDDGSPDTCPAMCDAWAEKDSRIKVIHKENGGLSDARNAGMAVATGEYMGFVDSDDWLEPEMYKQLLDAMVATGSDIASCGARRIWLDGRPAQELLAVNRDCVLEWADAMEALITARGLVQTVWNKLYKSSIMKDVLFLPGIIHEDEFWSWKVIARAKRVVTVKESFYNYLQRENSIMGAGFSEKSLLVVQAKIERQSYIEETMPELKDIGRTDMIYTCMHLGVPVIESMSRKDAAHYIKYLKCIIKRYPIGRNYLRELPYKQQLHLQMLQTLFGPVCWLHSIKQRLCSRRIACEARN